MSLWAIASGVGAAGGEFLIGLWAAFLLVFCDLTCEVIPNHENQPDRFGGNHPHRFGDLIHLDDGVRQTGGKSA